MFPPHKVREQQWSEWLPQQPPDLTSPFILPVLPGSSRGSLLPCRGQAGLWHHPSGTILG